MKQYFRFASTAPYAWAIYMSLMLFSQTMSDKLLAASPDGSMMGASFMLLSGLSGVWFVVQLIANTKRLIKEKPKFNLKKVSITLLILFIIGAVNNML